MFEKAIDEILSRWLRDGEFRRQLRHDPATVLADYQISREQQARLMKLKKQSVESGLGTAVSPPVKADRPVNLN